MAPKTATHSSQLTTVIVPVSSNPIRSVSETPGNSLNPSDQYGKYRIIRLLGKGGMGSVYEVEELESGRRIALKLLSQSLDASQDLQRFLREGRIAASINHPNSVYVFGTEEFQGISSIAMELVRGGTLQQRVKSQGPLPIGEAVDAILQVIQGLEAAEAFGILHRDIKPSNCFIEDSGTVKIGDFGLAIAPASRTDTNLTLTGAFLGTPTYASPEQLRGESLDVRSDIYGVGATLYYLLTGQNPFSGDNMVQLLANILERPPRPLAELRSGIPKELTGAIMRCLAKRKERRFKNYEELKKALLPFSRSAASPAPLDRRLLAGGLDYLAFSLAFGIISLILTTWFPGLSLLWNSSQLLAIILYFTVTEGLVGASPGKQAMGLHLTGVNGGAVSLPKIVLRTFLFPTLLQLVNMSFAVYGWPSGNGWWPRLIMAAFLAAIFSTSRRQNGFAGLHDLASQTRVVTILIACPQNEKAKSNSIIDTGAAAIGQSPAEGTCQIGPYQILKILHQTNRYDLMLGFDPRLLRQVWLVRWLKPEPPLSSALNNLARSSRLRWLTGRRTAHECWDAYAAIPGKPFIQMLSQPQPWSVVRKWLSDLAEELESGLNDKTLPPELGLDRIWIASDGQAKLLEFPAPGLPSPELGRSSPLLHSSEFDTDAFAMLFLRQVAVAALRGCPIGLEEARSQPIQVPLPIHALTFLNGLPLAINRPYLSANLKALMLKPSTVTSLRRRVVLWLSLPLALCFGTTGFVEYIPLMGNIPNMPDLSILRYGLAEIASFNNKAAELDDVALRQRQAWGIYIAANFRPVLNNDMVWSSLNQRGLLNREWRALGTNIVHQYPDPSPNEVQTALNDLQTFFPQSSQLANNNLWRRIVRGVLFMFGESWFQLIIMPSLLLTALLRSGPLLSLTGIAVVRKDGQPATRLLALVRGLVVWSPLLMMPLILPVLPEFQCLGIMLLLTSIGIIWGLISPQRGLPDLLLGTWLVPK